VSAGGAAPRVLDARTGPPEPGELDAVAAHLEAGGLVAHPTETVYGFGGLTTPAGLAALRRLKPGRDRPFIVLIPSAESAARLAWTPDARALASVFWPGALTLVLADPANSFPPDLHGEHGGVAIRVTSHPVTRALVERLGCPLTSTSANLPGQPPATSGAEALAAAVEAGAGSELWVLDAGRLEPSAPSTVVDCTGGVARVVRAGATPVHRLRCVLPEIDGER
jgi:L-threonylcarbamoyladenylate synthase